MQAPDTWHITALSTSPIAINGLIQTPASSPFASPFSGPCSEAFVHLLLVPAGCASFLAESVQDAEFVIGCVVSLSAGEAECLMHLLKTQIRSDDCANNKIIIKTTLEKLRWM